MSLGVVRQTTITSSENLLTWFLNRAMDNRLSFRRVLLGSLCEYCGIRPATTIDHIVPKGRGGPRKGGHNLAGACRPCNNQRGQIPMLIFFWKGRTHYTKHTDWYRRGGWGAIRPVQRRRASMAAGYGPSDRIIAGRNVSLSSFAKWMDRQIEIEAVTKGPTVLARSAG